jgi:hypothetical protein
MNHNPRLATRQPPSCIRVVSCKSRRESNHSARTHPDHPASSGTNQQARVPRRGRASFNQRLQLLDKSLQSFLVIVDQWNRHDHLAAGGCCLNTEGEIKTVQIETPKRGLAVAEQNVQDLDAHLRGTSAENRSPESTAVKRRAAALALVSGRPRLYGVLTRWRPSRYQYLLVAPPLSRNQSPGRGKYRPAVGVLRES